MNVRFELPDGDDRGVSSVIGVILMVAITVILAAVIASFVLGFGDTVTQTVQAGADISEDDDGTATVTWISGGNAASLNVSANGTHVGSDPSISAVGGTVTFDSSLAGVNSGSEVQVTVTAVGSGGTETVVTQRTVEITA